VAEVLYALERIHGFDLSTARIAKAHQWLAMQQLSDVALSVASLERIPYPDNSFDMVYTPHAIEPNGGREAPILQELYRVANHLLLLLEPCYELASSQAQARMREHGYCRNLAGSAEDLGYRILRHELFPISKNPLNPTGLMLIEKHTPQR
jgi:hypothetical protein